MPAGAWDAPSSKIGRFAWVVGFPVNRYSGYILQVQWTNVSESDVKFLLGSNVPKITKIG